MFYFELFQMIYFLQLYCKFKNSDLRDIYNIYLIKFQIAKTANGYRWPITKGRIEEECLEDGWPIIPNN